MLRWRSDASFTICLNKTTTSHFILLPFFIPKTRFIPLTTKGIITKDNILKHIFCMEGEMVQRRFSIDQSISIHWQLQQICCAWPWEAEANALQGWSLGPWHSALFGGAGLLELLWLVQTKARTTGKEMVSRGHQRVEMSSQPSISEFGLAPQWKNHSIPWFWLLTLQILENLILETMYSLFLKKNKQ